MPGHRSLVLHRGTVRSPRAALQRMLERVDDGTRPEEPVVELERRIADLLGTEAALFFPSGTMAQQAVLRVHAERSGRRAFAAHPQTPPATTGRRAATAPCTGCGSSARATATRC